ncbi:MAG: hypothetical protein V4617_01375 [Gemmatimonadota bacterium]
MRRSRLYAWRFAIAPLFVLVAALPLHSRTVGSTVRSEPTPPAPPAAGPASRVVDQQAAAVRRALVQDAHRLSAQDTAAVRRELRDLITRFQDEWRSAWQKIEVKRHGPIDLNQIRGYYVQSNGLKAPDSPTWEGDRISNNLTPSLQRYLSILCFVDTPTDEEIEAAKASSMQLGAPPVFSSQDAAAAAAAAASKVTVNIPRGAAGIGRVSLVTPRSIFGPSNVGAVCPSWNPSGEPLPLDEGESIDLALPPKDRPPLQRLRETLIVQLTNALSKHPNDPWIAGQRVRFIMDQREPERAVRAARDCQGSDRDCAALLGLALHHAENYASAEASFRTVDSLERAMAGPKAPCVSAEILLLLSEGDRSKVTDRPCAEQRATIERMWWLADPLWSVPGNERYVDHRARLAHMGLRSVTERDERYVWAPLMGGLAMRELLVRYGWPAYTYWPGGRFEDEMNRLRDAKIRFRAPPYTAKEYSYDRASLIPRFKAIANPFSVDSADYEIYRPAGLSNEQWWPQEHMALGIKLGSLPKGQQGSWSRDSLVLYGMIVDEPLRKVDTAATGPATATLVSSMGPQNFRTVATTPVLEGTTMRLVGALTSQPTVLSAEVPGRTLRETSWRARFGITPPQTLREMAAGEVALSAPVFLRMPNRTVVPPKALDTVMAYMAGDLTFSRTEPLALYWETYGFPLDQPLQLQVRVVRNDDVNIARRIVSSVGLASELRDSTAINWTEANSGQGALIRTTGKTAVGRSVSIDLKALPAGEYVVIVEVRRGTGMVATSRREFVLRAQ